MLCCICTLYNSNVHLCSKSQFVLCYEQHCMCSVHCAMCIMPLSDMKVTWLAKTSDLFFSCVEKLKSANEFRATFSLRPNSRRKRKSLVFFQFINFLWIVPMCSTRLGKARNPVSCAWVRNLHVSIFIRFRDSIS